MDFDFGTVRNDERPLLSSIADAMTSMKEAKADKIYRRIQKEGMTKYSKPQVDRALAKALNYGIFELRNNNLRVTDNILDDEDTIYWRAQIKQEESLSRLQGGDYINPEKDRRRFRRLSIFDKCRRTADIKRKASSGKKNKRNIVPKSTGKIKKNNRRNAGHGKETMKDDKNFKKKSSKKKGSKLPKSKPEEKRRPQKIIRKLTLKDAKKITRDPKGTYDLNAKSKYLKLYQKLYSENESTTDSLSTAETNNDFSENGDYYKNKSDRKKDYVKRGRGHENMDEVDYDSDLDDYDDDDDDGMSYGKDDQCECESDEDQDVESDSRYEQPKKEHNCSSHFDYMKYPIPSDITLSVVEETSKNTLRKKANDDNLENRFDSRGHSLCQDEILDSIRKTSNLNMDNYRPIENNLLGEGYGNLDWMCHNPENMHDKEIKQYDNALKIEPIDLLPFKNIGEASYIS